MSHSDTEPFIPASSVYGPVRSWRFGRSLGIDPVMAPSTCSFNCIYCQLGNIQRVTMERGVYVETAKIARDLSEHSPESFDVMTLSGNGEPTLASNLDAIIEVMRAHANKPIHMLTNSTLLYLPEVRQQACAVDMLNCKLDAIDAGHFSRINRPAEGVNLELTIKGLIETRRDYKGCLAMQIMLMSVAPETLEQWVKVLKKIAPDRVYLNTPTRPYPTQSYFEGRGDHGEGDCPFPTRTLRKVTPEQAGQFGEYLRGELDAEVISVYRNDD